MAIPSALADAVAELSRAFGHAFQVSEECVPGTSLHVVYADGHPLPERYSLATGVFGFRVPSNFPDAHPEDCFFLSPATLKLREADPARGSIDLHRASLDGNFVQGVAPISGDVLVFSWHIWNKVPWDRRRHTLVDHYTHCLRRFEAAEHD